MHSDKQENIDALKSALTLDFPETTFEVGPVDLSKYEANKGKFEITIVSWANLYFLQSIFSTFI